MTFLAASTLGPDLSTLNLADAAIRLGALLVIYLCFTVAQRFLSRKQLFREIELQLNLLLLVLRIRCASSHTKISISFDCACT